MTTKITFLPTRQRQFLWLILLLSCFVLLFSPGLIAPVNAQSISFSAHTLQGESLVNPTVLQFGPDGRLYVTQQDGMLYAYTIERTENGSNINYSITATEQINIIKNTVQNHNDDGTVNTTQQREVTGMMVTGTPTNPVLYVTSSDWRISVGNDSGLDTNSSIITRLTWTGSQWDRVDMVRGLARSEENHAINGLTLDESTNTLYVMVGGHTGKGAPANNLSGTPEYWTSAAMLSVDLDALEAMPIYTDPRNGSKYIYDLPTLDDPTRANITNTSPDFPYPPGHPMYNAAIDPGDPFGGNNGLNQAILTPDDPVQIYAPGFRNGYDVLLTEAGRLYVWDNGPSTNWGGLPFLRDAGNQAISFTSDNYNTLYDPNNGVYCTNEFNESGGNSGDEALSFVPGEGYYAGHPAPIRAFPSKAGIYVYEEINGSWALTDQRNMQDLIPAYITSRPGYSFSSYFPDDPTQCEYLADHADYFLTMGTASTNGLAEYTASNFNGALQGDILAAALDGVILRVALNNAGNGGTTSTLFSGFGSEPLDVTAQGDNEIFPGTVWAATYGAGNITVWEPQDFLECSGADSLLLDEDFDLYSNADEIDNNTDPCSGGSVPQDFDQAVDDITNGFRVSNLNDTDDDNDGILDINDAFAIDPNNGLTTNLPINYPFWNYDPGTGFFGVGFTGLMTNGVTDYLDQYANNLLTVGGAAGKFTIEGVAVGDSLGNINTQQNGFQFGLNINSSSPAFTIRTSLEAPYFADPQGNLLDPVDAQSYGLYLGNGDQDNYLKIVLRGDSGVDGFDVVLETNGTANSTRYNVANALAFGTVDLYFIVDPANNTAQPGYSLDGGNTIETLGLPISIPASWLSAADAQGLAIGLISTSRGSQPFVASWDFLTVLESGPAVNDPIDDVEVDVDSIPTAMDISNVFVDDGGLNNLTFTVDNVTNPTIFDDVHISYSGGTPILTLDYATNTTGTSDVTIRATDSGGLTVTDTFTVNIADVPGSCRGLVQEAEHGLVAGVFTIGYDPAASGGAYVHAPNGSGNQFTVVSQNYKVTYCFIIPQAGTYRISTNVYAANGEDDSFYMTVNGEVFTWDVFRNTTYAQDYVNNRGGADPVEVNLPEGPITLVLHVREDGARLDRIVLEPQQLVNTPPVANVGTYSNPIEDSDGLAGETLQLDGTGSTDADGTIASYEWTVNGTDTYTGAQPTVDLVDGENTIELVVTDNLGATSLPETINLEVVAPLTGIPTINGLVLIDGASLTDIGVLQDLDVLQLASLPSTVNIRANANGDTARVTFSITGDVTQNLNDGSTPFLAFAELSPWTPVVGSYTIVATPYTSDDTPGTPVTVNFDITNPPVPLVSDLQVSTGKTYQIGTLAVGSQVYTDRTYTMLTVPVALIGETYILTSNDDKSVTSPNYLSFTLGQNATIYVVWDSRNAPASWLNSWTTFGGQILTTDYQNTQLLRNIYSQSFSAGTVTLPGAALPNGRANYIVVVVPQNTPPVANAGTYSDPIEDSDGLAGETVQLDGTGSSDIDGTIASYAWTVNGTDNYTGAQPSVTLNDGANSISLVVTDDLGATSSPAAITINVSPVNTVVEFVSDKEELIFTAIQNTNSTTQSVQITNTGSVLVELDDLQFVGANQSLYTIVNPPTSPISLAPNEMTTIGIVFHPPLGVYGTLPATLQVSSHSPADYTVQVELYGLSIEGLEGDFEPSLQTIVDTLGYAISVGGNQLYLHPDLDDITPIGDEIYAELFEKAGPGAVTIITVARFSNVEPLPYGYYFPDGTSTPTLHEVNQIQNSSINPINHNTLYPLLATTASTFDPGASAFGVYAHGASYGYVSYTEDALNIGPRVRAARIYPVDDRDNNPIANTYLIAFDPSENGDFNDYVFLVSNINPVITNQIPVADAGGDQNVADSDNLPGETVTLDGTASFDSDGSVVSYLWTVNGTDTYTGAQPSVTLNDGANSISLVVTDDLNADSLADTATITVEAPEVVSTCGPLVQEAENGVLGGNFVIGSDVAASGGQYVHTPDGSGNQFSVTQTSIVTYCFNITQAGIYRINTNVYASNYSNDSFFVTFNGQTFLWDALVNTTYAADFVGDRLGADPVEIFLPVGEMPLVLHVREDGARLDRISLELISGSGNLMPIANAGSYPNPIQDSDGLVGETVQLNGTGSSDVDGTIASYAWTVNGTDNYTGAQPTVTLNDGANTVQLIVTDNEGADSTPVQITVNVEPPAVCGSLIQEAEFGDRSGSFVIGNDVAASGGQYVHRPNGAGDSFTAPGNSNVSFCFNVTQAGIYQIKGWVYAAGDSDDSFWVTVNGASYLWDTFVNQTYAEDYVNNRGGADPVQINLNAGDVTVTVHLREDGTRLDRIQLELITPTGNTPPVADAGADITVSDTDGLAGETLQLDGSASTDADGTIVSYAWTVNGTDNYTGAQPTVDLNDGQNTINLVVTDDGGAQASDTQIITVDAPNVDPVVVTGFFLVDAFTDTDFQPLLDNASLDINALPAGANIRVEISGTISDVVITLTGAVNQSVTESTAPYSLFGDTNGDFAAWTPVLGDYVLEAVPHLPGGAEGTSLTINFSIVDGGVGENLPPTADAGEDFTVQDTDSLPGESNVQLDGSGSSDPESGGLAYLWTVNGTDTYTGVQPLVDLADGQNSITLVVTDGQGASSGPDTVNVTVVAPVVGTPVINGLVLVDGGNNTDFGALQNFDVLQLVSLPSTLNIRADVNSDTARVTFSLTGDVTQNLNDGSAPFLAFAEFAPWTPIAGNFAIVATPYTIDDTLGTPVTVNFVITDPPVQLVSNLQVSTGKTYQVGTFGIGSQVYTDRNYTTVTIPAALNGATYILTSNDDKNVTVPNYLSFTLSQDATIYVIWDSRSSPVTWLAGWTPFGGQVLTTDYQNTQLLRNIYSQSFSAGTVTLPGAALPSSRANYIVVVVPQG